MAKKKTVRKKVPRKRAPSKNTVPWRDAMSVVVHGLPGVGKTEFGAAFPNPYFIIDPNETGINDLVNYGRVHKPLGVQEVSSFGHLLRVGEAVSTLLKLGVKTLIYDSMTGMENLCFQSHCAEHFDNDWSDRGFFAYQRGPKNAANTDWVEFIETLNTIMAEGISVILIAHTESKVYSNPTGPDHDRYVPFMDKTTWQQIHRWGSVVMFYGYHYSVLKEGIKSKAQENVERQLYTEWSPAYDAKNRFGLEPVIEAGDSGKEAFANFCKSFPKQQIHDEPPY